MRTIITCILMYLIIPTGVQAAVVISEVAWMGSTASANHEWIELYNTSDSSQTLDGWRLRDGMNLEISLAGVIDAGAYIVLERTSDESAPGSAFLLYSGALVNTGATLTLLNQSGSVMDQVAGGENWVEVGGDNATKETAQLTDRGWATGVASPGQPNSTHGSQVSGNQVDTTTPTTSASSTTAVTSRSSARSASAKETVKLIARDNVLALKIDTQPVAYVNQAVVMKVTASGVGDTIKNSLAYTWNFGDTYTHEGNRATHRYAYPGTYVVTVRGVYAKHDTTVRQEITVLPVTFSLTRNAAGDVQLHNDAPYDVDISGYTIAGQVPLRFPPGSIMLAHGTITIEAKRLEAVARSSYIHVYDEQAKLVLSSQDDENVSTDMVIAAATAPVVAMRPAVLTQASPRVQAASQFMFTTPTGSTEQSTTSTTTAAMPSNSLKITPPPALGAAAGPVPLNTNWTYVGLLGLFVVALTAVFVYPGRQKPV